MKKHMAIDSVVTWHITRNWPAFDGSTRDHRIRTEICNSKLNSKFNSNSIPNSMFPDSHFKSSIDRRYFGLIGLMYFMRAIQSDKPNLSQIQRINTFHIYEAF